MTRSSHLKRWGAAYLLAVFFLVSWSGQLVATIAEMRNEAAQHGQAFLMSEFWPRFWSATFENWQSEWLQLFVQAVILLGMKHVLFKADAIDMEQVQLDLAEVKEHLGIPPRDRKTSLDLRDARELRSVAQQVEEPDRQPSG